MPTKKRINATLVLIITPRYLSQKDNHVSLSPTIGVKVGICSTKFITTGNTKTSTAIHQYLFTNSFMSPLLILYHFFSANIIILSEIIYFNKFRFPFSSNTCICCMAIWLSFTRRSACAMPSLMSTALIFSIFDKQMSSLIVA